MNQTSKPALSPEARNLWFALKFHAVDPTDAESNVITHLMRNGGSIDADQLVKNMGLPDIEITNVLGSLAIKDAIRMERDDSGKHIVSANFGFASPLFGGVA